jgi:hypothetical protein
MQRSTTALQFRTQNKTLKKNILQQLSLFIIQTYKMVIAIKPNQKYMSLYYHS